MIGDIIVLHMSSHRLIVEAGRKHMLNIIIKRHIRKLMCCKMYRDGHKET